MARLLIILTVVTVGVYYITLILYLLGVLRVGQQSNEVWKSRFLLPFMLWAYRPKPKKVEEVKAEEPKKKKNRRRNKVLVNNN